MPPSHRPEPPPQPRPTPASIRNAEPPSAQGSSSSAVEERESQFRAEFGTKELQIDAQHIANKYAQAQVDEIRKTQDLRDKYARRVSRLLICWVSVAISLLVLDALDPPKAFNDRPWIAALIPAFDIEKQVMLTFLGGTTVAVVGLVLAVIKGLFPTPPKN